MVRFSGFLALPVSALSMTPAWGRVESSPVTDSSLLLVAMPLILLVLLGLLWKSGRLHFSARKVKNDAHQLQRSLDFVSSVLDSAVDMVFWVRIADGKVSYVNQSATEALGYSADQLIGMSQQVFDEELDEQRWQSFIGILAGGAPMYIESTYRAQDDSLFPVEMSMQLKTLGDEEFVIIFARDITARRQDEMRIRHNEERISAILDSAGDAIVVVDNLLLIDSFSMSAQSIFGYEPLDMIGHDFLQLFTAVDRQGVREFLLQQNDNEVVVTTGFSGRASSGRVFPLEMSVNRVSIDDENIHVCILRDVSERYAFEEELRQAKEQAEAGARAKSNFLANMSHEIRTPMNAIIGMTILASEVEKDDKNRSLLKKVLDASYALLQVMNDIIDFSRIDAGRIEVDRVPFSLRELVFNLKNRIERKSAIKHMQIWLEYDETLPLSLLGDPLRIRQVLMHLCDNAVKFTPDHGDIVIRVKQHASECHELSVLFEVQDSGIGIPAEMLGELFQTFEQLDPSSTRKYGGTGLGLAISRRLVEMMGGQIWVTSEPGKGSTFSFICCLAENTGKLHEVSVEDPVEVERLQITRLYGLKLLLVDPHELHRTSLTTSLEHYGLEVKGVSSVQEALQQAASRHYDGVLVDEHIADISPDQFLDRLTKLPVWADQPAFLLSSQNVLHFEGFKETISKPVFVDDILAALDKWSGENLSYKPRQSGDEPVQNTTGSGLDLLKGIDIEDALKRTRNKQSLLDKLLKMFLDRETEFSSRFDQAWSAGNQEEAVREAHSLKGVAGNLGAADLQAKALKLEMACHDQKAGVETLAAETAAELDRVLQGIRAYLAFSERAQMSPVLDMGQVKVLMEKLEKLVRTDNVKSLDVIEELEPLLQGEQFSSCFRSLANAVRTYDFDSAQADLSTLQSLLNSVGEPAG